MPLRSAGEFVNALCETTDEFTTKFAEAAAKFPKSWERRAAQQFINNINTNINKMQVCIRPQDPTLSLADVLSCLKGFTGYLQEDIFNLETFPLWQAYIESLLKLIAAQMEEDPGQDLCTQLGKFISTEYARRCWLDLCVFDVHQREFPELAQPHQVPAEHELVVGYFYPMYNNTLIQRKKSFSKFSTNFCLFYFDILLQEAVRPANLNQRDPFSLHLSPTSYREILRQVTKSVLACSTEPLVDPRLTQALEYLGLSSFNPTLVQAFIRSSSIFLFSPHFFLNLLTLPQGSVEELLQVVIPIPKDEMFTLTPDLLLDWLNQLRTIDAQKTLILAIEELLSTSKLNFLLDLPDLPPNTPRQFLRLLLLHDEPARIVNAIVSTLRLRQDPNFLDLFDALEPGSMLSDFIAFILQRYQQGSINKHLFGQLKILLRDLQQRRENEEYDIYVERISPFNNYLHDLTKCKGEAATIDYFLSLATTANTPQDLEALRRLTGIFRRAMNNLDDPIHLISDGSMETFQEKFENSNVLHILRLLRRDFLVHLLNGDLIKKETIKVFRECKDLENLGHLFSGPSLSRYVSCGIEHLLIIGIPLKNILTFTNHYNAAVFEAHINAFNRPASKEHAQELVRSFFNDIQDNTERMALFLSFALGNRLKDRSPDEKGYSNCIRQTLYNYFEIFKSVIAHIGEDRYAQATARLHTLFARVIQQESRNADFLMSEANMVADAVDALKEAQAATDMADEGEPLPTLVLRAAVYEHSLLLFRREVQKPQAIRVLSTDAPQPVNPTDPQKHKDFVDSFFAKSPAP